MADAYTRLTDTIIPSVWARYQYEESVEKLDIFNAGVLYSDSEITSQLANGGFAVDMPMWNYIPHIPSEAVNDDPTDNIEVKKITSRTERAARNIRAQAWGNMDINRILAGDDPQRIIVQHQAEYWQYANKTTLLAMLSGMVLDNINNNAGDLVVATGTTVTELNVIDAAYLMGDQADRFTTIWLHSRQMAALKKLDLIDYVPSSQQGGMLLPYYMGLRCIVDDGLPGVSAGAGLTTYTAYMFKPRAIHWAELPVDTDGGPLEFDRKPRAGHGGGMTETVGRRHFVPHVKGMTLTGTPAGKFATDAEYRTDAFWARATADKKNIGFVALRTTEVTPGTT